MTFKALKNKTTITLFAVLVFFAGYSTRLSAQFLGEKALKDYDENYFSNSVAIFPQSIKIKERADFIVCLLNYIIPK